MEIHGCNYMLEIDWIVLLSTEGDIFLEYYQFYIKIKIDYINYYFEKYDCFAFRIIWKNILFLHISSYTKNERSTYTIIKKDHFLTMPDNICGRISPKINGICSIHKRVGNGVCYIPYCRKTAIEKNLMCQSHTFDATPVCICNKHHYPKKYIKNTFNIPNDILTYFHFP